MQERESFSTRATPPPIFPPQEPVISDAEKKRIERDAMWKAIGGAGATIGLIGVAGLGLAFAGKGRAVAKFGMPLLLPVGRKLGDAVRNQLNSPDENPVKSLVHAVSGKVSRFRKFPFNPVSKPRS